MTIVILSAKSPADKRKQPSRKLGSGRRDEMEASIEGE
jgi:hypothetical protein